MEFTEHQQVYGQCLLDMQSRWALSGWASPGAPVIKEFLPAPDGLNLYVRYSDGSLWYTNNAWEDDRWLTPVSEGPVIDV